MSIIRFGIEETKIMRESLAQLALKVEGQGQELHHVVSKNKINFDVAVLTPTTQLPNKVKFSGYNAFCFVSVTSMEIGDLPG